MNFPDNLQSSPEHTWLIVNSDTGTVGITEFAQSELGEIVFVDLPAIGATFKTGKVFGSIEALKTVSDLFMPVNGKGVTINDRPKDNPTLLNDDPFAEGWLIKVRITGNAGLKDLLNTQQYLQKVGA